MRFIAFLVLIAGAVVGLGDRLAIMIDIPSGLIVLWGALGGVLAAFGRDVGKGFRAVFARRPTREVLTTGMEVLERGKSFAVAAGVLGTATGQVIMLKNLDDPAAIGPGLALSFLTHIYALLLAYGIFALLAAALRRRLLEMQERGGA